MEHEFKCQECGELLIQDDSVQRIENMSQSIERIDEELKEYDERKLKALTRRIKKNTKKVVKKKTTPKYKVTVSVNDVEHTSTGKTIKDALANFIESDKFPFGAKTPAVFTVAKGKKKSTTRLYPQRARRMFLTLQHKSTALDVFSAQLERHFNA